MLFVLQNALSLSVVHSFDDPKANDIYSVLSQLTLPRPAATNTEPELVVRTMC